MFSLDDEDTSQSELASLGASYFDSEMSRGQYIINCDGGEKMSSNKSEIYRRLEFNKKMFTEDPTDASASASTSRFENLILNGSVSVPTNSFVYSDQYREVQTIKIVNRPPTEVEVFETIDLATDGEAVASATEGRRDNRPSMSDLVNERFVNHLAAPPPSTDERKKRFVMAVVIGSVAGVTVVIIVIGKFFF